TIVHPMGIDFEKFSSVAASIDEGAIAAEGMTSDAKDAKVIFSVSRLDYTKGILQALESYGLLLERHPELWTKVIFVLCVVPSREKVDRYAHLKREIDEAVGRINSAYGR